MTNSIFTFNDEQQQQQQQKYHTLGFMKSSFGVAAKNPTVTRRAVAYARSSSKHGKARFDFQDALRKDRDRIERLKGATWKHRLESLKVYPWKFFIAFMVGWSYLGLYVVPYVKDAQPHSTSTKVDLGRLPRSIHEKVVSNSSFVVKKNENEKIIP